MRFLRSCTVLAGLSLTLPHAAHAQTQPTTANGRPLSVPTSYVATPFGYYHPSCIVHMTSGDVIDHAHHTIHHANGADTAMEACPYAIYAADGRPVRPDARKIINPDGERPHGLGFKILSDTSVYGGVSAQWTVPPAPTNQKNQVVYLAQEMEDLNATNADLISSLGWNADFHNAWGIATWNSTFLGKAYESAPQKVAPGDTIASSIYSNCAAGTQSCPTWNLAIKDLRSGKTSQLLQTSADGEIYNYVLGGEMISFHVLSCDQYPAANAASTSQLVSINNVVLYDANLTPIANPKWSAFAGNPYGVSCPLKPALGQTFNLAY